MSAQLSTSEVGAAAAAAAAARGDRLGGEVRDDEGVRAIRISFQGSPSRLNASNPKRTGNSNRAVLPLLRPTVILINYAFTKILNYRIWPL